MNNEELIAKIASMAPGLIKEAEESGSEINHKVDPEVSTEIIAFLLKTPATLKDILHDVSFAALRHLEAMGEVRPRLYVQTGDIKLEWLAEDDCWDSGPLVTYMNETDPDYTLPDAWFRVLVNSLGCCVANRNDEFNDEIVDDGGEDPEQGDN